MGCCLTHSAIGIQEKIITRLYGSIHIDGYNIGLGWLRIIVLTSHKAAEQSSCEQHVIYNRMSWI